MRLRAKHFWCAVLCAAAVSIASVAAADDKRRDHGDKRRGEHRSWAHDHHQRHHHRDGHWRGRDRRGWYGWSEARERDDDYRRRYYAHERPPLHRYGHRCSDRRHYHGVHYHVLARDYYDYYYPRYRYYGAAPLDAHASVIITLPLF